MIDHQDYTNAVRNVFNDLLSLDLGTPAQRRSALRLLWVTYLSEWLAFMNFGDVGDSESIDSLIQNDATPGLAWLDTQISGQAIRAHIVARLNSVS